MTMKNQKRPPYNTIPHYIVSDYRNGKLNINQLRLLQWIRAIGTPYGIAITSLVDLNNDVFPDLDLKINTINSYLIKLRQRQYIFFEPRQGKMGTFEIHLNHWLTPNMDYKTLDKFFPEPERWKEIASELGDEFINSIVSVLRKDGFRLIERAWGIFREHRQEGKKMDNPARYFQGIIKKLR